MTGMDRIIQVATAADELHAGFWLAWPVRRAETGSKVDLIAIGEWESGFSGPYALIAAMSGWMPTMFMTRVRL